VPGYNHRPGCPCGWCDKTASAYVSPPILPVAREAVPWGRSQYRCDSYTNPNASCPVCGQEVFYYQSRYGGRVFFDELGPPWPKHACTDDGRPPIRLTKFPTSTLNNHKVTPDGWRSVVSFSLGELRYDWREIIVQSEAADKSIRGFMHPPVSLPEENAPIFFREPKPNGVGQICWPRLSESSEAQFKPLLFVRPLLANVSIECLKAADRMQQIEAEQVLLSLCRSIPDFMANDYRVDQISDERKQLLKHWLNKAIEAGSKIPEVSILINRFNGIV